MNITLNRNNTTPLYLQLKNSIRSMILSEELPENFKLPSERNLAAKLSVHRNTVVKAYEALIAEGLIYSSRKKPCGYFVGHNFSKSEIISDPQKVMTFSSLDKNLNYHFINMQNRFEELYHSSYDTEQISFAGVLTDRTALPVEYLKHMLQEIIDGDDLEPFWFCDPQGTKRLRMAISEMLFGRNIYTSPRNIQIVSETYEAISNIAFMYLNPGDYVIIEAPACPAIANIFLHVGAKLLSVPIEPDGIRMDILEHFVQQYNPKLIYTMPNYQNPSTCTMTLEMRKRLLVCALSYNIPILEDDSQYDFYYGDNRLPSLYSMDQSDSVIYLDTAGLSFYPGSRLGFIVAPDNVINTYRHIVNKDQMFLNSMSQYLWADFFQKGYYKKHVRFLTDFYIKKRELMCQCLSKIQGLSFLKPEGGMVIWARMPENTNDLQIVSLCKKMGLLLMPGSLFFPEGNKGDNYLRISFSSASDEQILRGTEILQKALSVCQSGNQDPKKL